MSGSETSQRRADCVFWQGLFWEGGEHGSGAADGADGSGRHGRGQSSSECWQQVASAKSAMVVVPALGDGGAARLLR